MGAFLLPEICVKIHLVTFHLSGLAPCTDAELE